MLNMPGGKTIDPDEKRSDSYCQSSYYINDTLSSFSGYRAITRRNCQQRGKKWASVYMY